MSRPSHFVARSAQPASAQALFAWHARPGALERLTPPWEATEVLERTGEGLAVGSRVVMRVRVGGLPRRWVAEHTAREDGPAAWGFQDVQREGPFASWVHTHRMRPAGPGASELEDAVEYRLPLGALGRVGGGRFARAQLERMFAYRHAVTRADLARHAAAGLPPLTVAVSGASGLLGQALCAFLSTGGHRVLRLVRGRARGPDAVAWDAERGTVDAGALAGVDAVVHLAGAGIADARWSPARKEVLERSRLVGTRALAEAVARLPRPPRAFVSASAVGVYGSRGDEVLTEASAPGDDFLARLCRRWEDAAAPARAAGVRTVHLRTGLVLSARGGALAKMLPSFRAGAGGPVGSGAQWVSWVSLEDVLGLVLHALATPGLSGPVNVVAPEPVRQRDFARALGRALSRPAVLPLPAPAVRAAFGELGDALLLASQRVAPAAAQAAGFRFVHPELDAALRFALGRAGPAEAGVSFGP